MDSLVMMGIIYQQALWRLSDVAELFAFVRVSLRPSGDGSWECGKISVKKTNRKVRRANAPRKIILLKNYIIL